MVQLSLPAGNYAITAKGHTVNRDRDGIAICRLTLGGTELDEFFAHTQDLSALDSYMEGAIVLLGVGSAGSPTTAALSCATTIDGQAFADQKIMAIKVGALH